MVRICISLESHYQGVDSVDARHDWEELSCGIYSLCMESLSEIFFGISRIQKHQWTNALLNDLIKWERRPMNPQQYVLADATCHFSSYGGDFERNFSKIL